MNWLKLYDRIGRQPIHANRREVYTVVSVGDLRNLIDGRDDWEYLELPLDLKYSQERINNKWQQVFYLILRKDKAGKVIQR